MSSKCKKSVACGRPRGWNRHPGNRSGIGSKLPMNSVNRPQRKKALGDVFYPKPTHFIPSKKFINSSNKVVPGQWTNLMLEHCFLVHPFFKFRQTQKNREPKWLFFRGSVSRAGIRVRERRGVLWCEWTLVSGLTLGRHRFGVAFSVLGRNISGR